MSYNNTTPEIQRLLDIRPESMEQRIARMDTLLTLLVRDLYGNGGPGIHERLRGLEQFKWFILGVGALAGSVITVVINHFR